MEIVGEREKERRGEEEKDGEPLQNINICID